jgi:hypothetical protein
MTKINPTYREFEGFAVRILVFAFRHCYDFRIGESNIINWGFLGSKFIRQEARGSVVVEALCCKPEGYGIASR